jgi:hypothetical protein
MIDALEHEKVTRNEVVRRLCRLASEVARDHFNHMEAADCFCGQSAEGYQTGKAVMTALGMGDYRFSEKVLTFIEDAVAEKLASV